MKNRILVVDDEPEIREIIKDALSDEGYEVYVAGSGEEGVSTARYRKFDVVVLDVRMAGMDGIIAYQLIKRIRPQTKALFITAYYPENIILGAIPKGEDTYLQKPFDVEELLCMVDQLCN